jgi:8-oxo-dGTP pyrophosphatase MutT (NUDIX family)
MALPGGKRDPEDAGALDTAVREAQEEVGVDLPPPTGRLDDVRGRVHAGIVATYVFTLDHRPPLRPALDEVAAAVWIPLRTLLSSEAASSIRMGAVSPLSATTST